MTEAASEPDPCGMLTNDLEVAVAARGAAGPGRRPRRSACAACASPTAASRGARRRRPRRPPRRGARPARPQRRGQDDPGRDPRGPPPADAGEVDVLGHDPAQRERAFRARIGIVLQEDGHRPVADRARGRRALRRRLPAPRGRSTRCSSSSAWPTAPDVRVRGALRRPAAAARPRARHRRRPRARLPRRADDRLRPVARRRQSWELISALRDLGKTILLTTHYMDEAQHLADRVVVIARRQRHRRGHAGHARRAAPPRRRSSPSASRTASRATSCRCPAAPRSSAATGSSPSAPAPRPATSRRCSPGPRTPAIELEALTVTRPSLEDVYLQLTEEPA